MKELISFVSSANVVTKAICIEALEKFTAINPNSIDKKAFEFLVRAAEDPSPRVDWESARMIANVAHLHPENLSPVIPILLDMAESGDTVRRWSAARALIEIKNRSQ